MFEDKYQGFKQISCMTENKTEYLRNCWLDFVKISAILVRMINFHQNLWLAVTWLCNLAKNGLYVHTIIDE